MPIVSLRPARLDDAALLFAWQQHPETRKYARNPEAPQWEGHLEWLGAVLKSNMRTLLIAEQDGHPVGMLRFDSGIDDAEVSIVVAPGLRRRGIGTAMLAAMKTGFPQHHFSAYIDCVNLASAHVFERAGFRPLFDGWWVYRPSPSIMVGFDSAELGDPMNPRGAQVYSGDDRRDAS